MVQMCFRMSRYKCTRACSKTQPAPGQSWIKSALEDFQPRAQAQRNISKSLRLTVNFYSPTVHVKHSRSIWRHLQHSTSQPRVVFVTPAKRANLFNILSAFINVIHVPCQDQMTRSCKFKRLPRTEIGDKVRERGLIEGPHPKVFWRAHVRNFHFTIPPNLAKVHS